MSGFNATMNIAKAIGIVTIVMRHLNIDIFSKIFPSGSFEIPLFFFIAGYFFKIEHINTIKNLIKYLFNKAKKYLGIFYLYRIFFIFIAIYCYKSFAINYGNIGFNLYDFLISPFFNGNYGFDIANWFLIQLFVSLAVFAIILYIIPQKRLLMFLSLFIAGILLCKENFLPASDFRLLFSRTFLSVWFIYLGYLYKTEFQSKIKFDIKTLGIVLLIQAIAILISDNNIEYDFITAQIHKNIGILICPITGIYFVLFLSNLLTMLVKEGSFLDKTGKNTLHIMSLHIFVIFITEIIILAFDKKIGTNLSKNYIFDWYKIDKYFPLYAIVSLVICTHISDIFKYIYKNTPLKNVNFLDNKNKGLQH